MVGRGDSRLRLVRRVHLPDLLWTGGITIKWNRGGESLNYLLVCAKVERCGDIKIQSEIKGGLVIIKKEGGT
jgi:hypothetical protein